MGICSYVNKMTATEHDTESMNRHVEQMVQEAILASGVERVMNEGVEENIFSDSFSKEVEEIKHTVGQTRYRPNIFRRCSRKRLTHIIPVIS